MSLGKIYKFYNEKYQKEISEQHYDISKLIIPFSRLFKKNKSSDIYSGKEKIPFNERISDYKFILKQEFKNYFKAY